MSKNVHAQALSRLGSKKGGNARAHKLSPLERSKIAKQGADKRWHHSMDKPKPPARQASRKK